MNSNVEDNVVEAIIVETVATLPSGFLEFYKDLPGRKPSELSVRLAAAWMAVDEDDAIDMIRDVVDRTVFSMLYLIDARFKNLKIATSFDHADTSAEPFPTDLHNRYRQRVEPGGLIWRE